MLTKAIVDKVIDTNAIRVRIPVFNKASYNVNATPSEELYVATVCTLPNCEIPFQVGDVVIVGFEDNQASKPVIIGYLFRKTDYLCKADLKLSSLIVDGNVKFSNEVRIGEIDYNDILKLKGIKDNIQQQLDILTNRIDKLMYGNSTNSGNADTPTVDPGTEDNTDTSTDSTFVELEDYEKYGKYVSSYGLTKGLQPTSTYEDTPIFDEPNLSTFYVSTLYGNDETTRTHYGIDCQNGWLDGGVSRRLTAPCRSKIINYGYEEGRYGHWIQLLHGNGYSTRYAHLHSQLYMNKQVGAILEAGTVFANMGGDLEDPEAGSSTGPHLHFEVRKDCTETELVGTLLEPYAVLFGDWQLPDYEGEL